MVGLSLHMLFRVGFSLHKILLVGLSLQMIFMVGGSFSKILMVGLSLYKIFIVPIHITLLVGFPLKFNIYLWVGAGFHCTYFREFCGLAYFLLILFNIA